MKKIFNKLFALVLCVMACVSAIMIVNAEAAPQTFKATNYVDNNTPISFPATNWVKKTTAGKYVYCVHYAKNTPTTNVTYTKGNLVTDNGMNYILKQAYGAKNDDEHFIYQSALWMYMVDKGIMPGPHYTLTVFNSQVKNSNAAVARQINDIVAKAKAAGANDTSAPTIKVSEGKNYLSLDKSNKYYVSDAITVNSSTGSYNVTLTSAPSGSTVEKNGNKFVVKVPASSVNALKTTISYKVSNSKDVYTSYYYNPSNSSYQVLTDTFKNTKTASTTGSLLIVESANIQIIKVDAATGEAIKGAKLELTNTTNNCKNNCATVKFTSQLTPWTANLGEGTYTVRETEAPEGYELNDKVIKIKVDAKGNVTDENGNKVEKIVIKNYRKTAKIPILKVDAETGEPIKGAKLELTNVSSCTTKCATVKFTSQLTPWYTDLGEGTYTLKETEAPKGYKLIDEVITFKVDAYGNVTDSEGNKIEKIEIANEKMTGGVSISKQDITNKKELPGATLVVKDYDGNVIEKWVSTDKPHIIENLKPGTYTLTETIAPEGYILSSETITFTVKDDGEITKVVMYNTPDGKEVPEDTPVEVPVESTSSFKTMTSSLIGVIVIAVGSYIILRNSKKKENV